MTRHKFGLWYVAQWFLSLWIPLKKNLWTLLFLETCCMMCFNLWTFARVVIICGSDCVNLNCRKSSHVVKVKFTLEQAMKNQVGSRVIALPFFNLGASWRCGQCLSPATVCLGKGPGTHSTSGWVGPRVQKVSLHQNSAPRPSSL
jgi:hypothetical protein